jgi:hypothetical protein
VSTTEPMRTRSRSSSVKFSPTTSMWDTSSSPPSVNIPLSRDHNPMPATWPVTLRDRQVLNDRVLYERGSGTTVSPSLRGGHRRRKQPMSGDGKGRLAPSISRSMSPSLMRRSSSQPMFTDFGKQGLAPLGHHYHDRCLVFQFASADAAQTRTDTARHLCGTFCKTDNTISHIRRH